MIAYALLCQPLATITPIKTVVTTRIVQIRPSEVENKFELEILEAPPIAVNQEDDD